MPEEITEEQRKAMEEKLKNMSPEEIAELQKQQCIFCQILSGKIPSKKVHEDEKCVVILDINPAAKGHCLLLPKNHYSIMPQIPEDEMSHMFLVSKAMSQILLKSLRVDGTNIFVANGAAAGQRAPHFMIHIIPRKEGDDLLAFDTKLVDLDERKDLLKKIEARFNQVMGIKKEVVEVKDPEEAEPEEKVVEEPEEAESDEEDKEGNEDQEEGEGDDEEDTEEDDADDEEEPEDSQDEDDEKPDPKKDDDNASLDDIANLFK